VVKVLDTSEKRELAFFGVTKVHAPPSLLIALFQDIENFKKADAVLKVKKLSNPPVPDDFKEMTLEPDDINELKKCKPGKCDMKLSEEMILRFNREINWAAKDSTSRAQELFRKLLFEYVQNYLLKGKEALYRYQDEKKAVLLSQELDGILNGSQHLLESHPDFFRYLGDFSGNRSGSFDTFLYWSKETLGFRPVITLTHVVIDRSIPGASVFASKQIYSNHYMNGSLSLTGLFSENIDPQNPEFYMTYSNRSRTDMLEGLLSGLKRSIARSKSSAAVRENMMLTKKRLEKDYKASEP